MPITAKDLTHWFAYHDPNVGQLIRYQAIRKAALSLATVILENTDSCADQTAAIRKVREAVMIANAAIACENVSSDE